MSWTMETEDLRVVEVKLTKRSRGKTRPRTVKKNYKLPAPYHRLVSQLVTEIDFAEGYNTHESHRRQVYAEEVLDEFGKELDGLKSTEDTAMVGFRSVVLTPILQRQLFGIHDAYTPYVHSIIMDNNPKLNIEAVTKFYLGEDPTDPAYIPTYRRNLLYLPEARWHLGLTMGVLGKLPEPKACGLYFDKIQNHHDMIIEALPGLEYDHDRFPLLTQAERSAIIEEGLELFFEEELARPVRHIFLFTALCLPIIDLITPRNRPRQPQPLGHHHSPHHNPQNQHSQIPHNQNAQNQSDPVIPPPFSSACLTTANVIAQSHVQHPK